MLPRCSPAIGGFASCHARGTRSPPLLSECKPPLAAVNSSFLVRSAVMEPSESPSTSPEQDEAQARAARILAVLNSPVPSSSSPRTPRSKRNILSLEQRVDVLKLLDQGTSCRSLAQTLGCGKSQIATIKRERDTILREWAAGTRSDLKYLRKRKAVYAELNDLVWSWFCCARAENTIVSGRMIQEKARMLATALNHEGFTASNGWLECWQRRYNVKLASLNKQTKQAQNEDGETSGNDNRTSFALPELIQAYPPANVFCVGEMGLFYRVLPQQSQVIREDPFKGAKSSRERITVVLTCSAAGRKLTPLVVGRSEQPESFQGITLPVTYCSNRRAWMTSAIFTEWLEELNDKMKDEDRKILLIVGISGVHPNIERSNVKLLFVPTSTSSYHQPCNTGIIQAVKINYRKHFISHVLSEMDKGRAPLDIVNKVTICDAISWLNMAWEGLQEMAIANFFRRCGFQVDVGSGLEGNGSLDVDMEPDLGPQFAILMGGIPWALFVSCDQDTATTFTVQGGECTEQDVGAEVDEEEEGEENWEEKTIKEENAAEEDVEMAMSFRFSGSGAGKEDWVKSFGFRSKDEDVGDDERKSKVGDEEEENVESWQRETTEKKDEDESEQKDEEERRSASPVISTKEALDYMKDLIDLAFHLGDAGMVSAAARYQSLLIEHHLKQANTDTHKMLEDSAGGTHS